MALPHSYKEISEDNDALVSGCNSNTQRLYPHHALHSAPTAQTGQALPRLQIQNQNKLHLRGAVLQDLPGNTRRSAIRPRRNLRWGPEGIRRGTRPGGHRGRGPTSRRWPRSWSARPRSGGGHCRSSPLRRGAGRGGPAKQTKAFNCSNSSGIPLPPQAAFSVSL